MATSRPTVPLGRARRGAAKLSIKPEEALRHWAGLPLEARQHLLHFRDRGIVDRAFAIQEGLRKFEQDCMQKGIVFRNTEGQTVVSLGLSSFAFLPQGSSPLEQVAPDAFFARGALLSNTDDEFAYFAGYLETRLGGFLTGIRPPLRRDLWSGLFAPEPHSWVEFECQALRLVEQAILHSYLEAASAAAAAEAAAASNAGEPPEDAWLALAEELSEPAPAPGKKARRKAARRRVRLAAAASGGECEGKGETEAEANEELVPGDAPSGKETWPSGNIAVEEADPSCLAGGEQEMISPSRKKDRKQVADLLSFGGHSRVNSQSSAWADTVCGSSSGVKSNNSECGSETVESGSDVGDVAVLSMGMDAPPNDTIDVHEIVINAVPELPSTKSAEWISNGCWGDAAEWHLCLPVDLSRPSGNSSCPSHLPASSAGFRAVVKRTFLDVEVASWRTEPLRLRARSVDARF